LFCGILPFCRNFLFNGRKRGKCLPVNDCRANIADDVIGSWYLVFFNDFTNKIKVAPGDKNKLNRLFLLFYRSIELFSSFFGTT